MQYEKCSPTAIPAVREHFTYFLYELIGCLIIPKDPMILLSYVNTQLRDYYDSLEALCTCRGLKKDELVAKMHSIDYEYDEATNQFI